MIEYNKNKLFHKTMFMLVVGTISMVIVLLILEDIICSVSPVISNPIIVFTIIVLFTIIGLNAIISFIKLWNKLFL